MNKMLTATIAASFPFFSQAISPTIYGSLELAVAHTDQGFAINTNPNSNGAFIITNPESGTYLEDNWSYLGVNGKEHVNNFFSILYQIEFSIEDESISKRDTFLGIDSQYGLLLLGRNHTAFGNAPGNVDIFGNTNASMSQLMVGGDRQSRNLSYYSPTYRDIVNFSTNILMEDTTRDDSYPFSVAINLGDPELTKQPYYFSIAYNKELEGFKGYQGAAQVKIDDVQIGALFQHNDGTETLGTNPNNNLEGNSYIVNVRYNLARFAFEQINLKLMYGKDSSGLGDYFQTVIGSINERSPGSSPFQFSDITDVNVQQFAFAANYHASESAVFYAVYANYRSQFKDKGIFEELFKENTYTIGLRYNF